VPLVKIIQHRIHHIFDNNACTINYNNIVGLINNNESLFSNDIILNKVGGQYCKIKC